MRKARGGTVTPVTCAPTGEVFYDLSQGVGAASSRPPRGLRGSRRPLRRRAPEPARYSLLPRPLLQIRLRAVQMLNRQEARLSAAPEHRPQGHHRVAVWLA